MFDTIFCEFPLPIKKFQKNDFQTKDTPNQFLDLYKIKENGTLWRETYEIEDKSDPNAEGIKSSPDKLTFTILSAKTVGLSLQLSLKMARLKK